MRTSRISYLLHVSVLVGMIFLSSTAYGLEEGAFSEKLKTALAHSQWGGALVLSYVAGLLASLTACVYPLIPITVSLFGAKQADHSRLRKVGLAFSFILGIATMYTALGVGVSLLGKQFGSFLTSPYLMVPVIGMFLLMAASLLGAFSLQLPPQLQRVLQNIGGKGLRGAFLMGLVSGVIASPCTGPSLAALLSFVASQGSVLLGSLLLFSYALGLGTLFFLVAAFSLSLPKSGPWMDGAKSILAILLIMVALYFMRNLSTPLYQYGRREWMFLFGHLSLILMGILVGGIHLRFQRELWTGIRKLVGVLLISFGGFGVLSWLLALPKLAWSNNPQALMEAKEQHRPVLIDFYASWCLPCVTMETQTFADPQIQAVLQSFVLWKVDCSKGCESTSKQYQIRTLPGVILLDAEGQIVQKKEGFVSKEELLPILLQMKAGDPIPK